MRMRWCWRCRNEVPMLDAFEFALVERARDEGLEFVEAERKRRGLPRQEPLELPDHDEERFEGFLAMLEMHRLLTGYLVRDMREAYSHRISRHGPPCPECDKPLRSLRARYCAACGFGMEDLPGDVPPLVERRLDAFDFVAFPEGRL